MDFGVDQQLLLRQLLYAMGIVANDNPHTELIVRYTNTADGGFAYMYKVVIYTSQ